MTRRDVLDACESCGRPIGRHATNIHAVVHRVTGEHRSVTLCARCVIHGHLAHLATRHRRREQHMSTHDDLLAFVREVEAEQRESYRRQAAERPSEAQTASAQSYAEALAAARSTWHTIDMEEN